MGNKNSKSNLKNAIIYLNISADRIKVHDEKFWNQIWTEDVANAAEIIKSISTREIRILRDGSPVNFATLTYKMVDKLYATTNTLCNTHAQQAAVMNATRMLIRIIPCIFEEPSWRNFFTDNRLQAPISGDKHSLVEPELVFPKKPRELQNYTKYLPPGIDVKEEVEEDLKNDGFLREGTIISIDTHPDSNKPIESSSGRKDSPVTNHDTSDKTLLGCLVSSISDLLFCPEFTVLPDTESNLNADVPPEDLRSLTTFEYVWEPGVGFESDANSTTYFDKSRSELLRLLLTCFSATLYEAPERSLRSRNYWIESFATSKNRHALSIFTSLLNVVFVHRSSRLLPFSKLLFEDTREELVEVALHILIVVTDYQSEDSSTGTDKKNLFVEYLSRIHRDEDFVFMVKGFTRLLNVPLTQNYLMNSASNAGFDQELLILLWKTCTFNNKFLSFLLKNKDALDILVPILYHLNEDMKNPAKSALIHIGVFNLLILSGERNFGVILNAPYTTNLLPDLPQFSGSHADLLIVVIHKLILYGQNLQQLFDYLLTVVVNVSPYIKSMTLLASKCLMQIFEIFSSPFIIYTEPNYHQIVIFMLEIFNNLIQYQFDGNTNMVFMILAKREVFANLDSLPETDDGIKRVLKKLLKRKRRLDELEKQNSVTGSVVQQPDETESQQTDDQPDLTSNSITPLSATLSSCNIQPAEISRKREVSLIATPGIDHVTQAVNPFQYKKNPQFFFGEEDTKTVDQNDSDHSTDQLEQRVRTDNDLEKFDCSKNPVSLLDQEHGIIDQEHDCPTGSLETTKWRPSPDWVAKWKKSLPLHTCLRMIEVLAPQLEQFEGASKGQVCSEDLMKFLKSGTLVGLLPVPHPISIRKYHNNDETSLWFRTCTWGVIYVRNTIWTDTRVKLIKLL